MVIAVARVELRKTKQQVGSGEASGMKVAWCPGECLVMAAPHSADVAVEQGL